MDIHERIDAHLSAYMDGALADDERAEVDRHLAGCTRCTETLAALRATGIDLLLLADAEPSAQDSWALRSAIARARKRPARLTRALVAASGAAAVLIAVVVAVNLGSDRDRSAGTTSAAMDLASPMVVAEDTDYDPSTARALLTSSERYGMSVDAAPAAPGPQEKSAETNAAAGSAPVADGDTPRVEACRAAIFPDGGGTPEHYVAARYEGTKAFLMIFRVDDHRELWVVARDTCDVLFFAQS